MAALILIVAAGLGFGIGWFAKSAGRRVIDIELPDTQDNNTEKTIEKDAAADPMGK